MAELEAIIEISRGTRNKYEINHDTGELWLDRFLYTSMAYPTDYGFFPGTLGEDGDPLDAMVMTTEPLPPLCHLHVRPVAMFMMTDESGGDAKILCVPAGDHRWDWLQDLSDVPDNIKEEIHHFFEHYKDLEPNKESEMDGWSDLDVAIAEIEAAQKRHG